MATRLRAMRVEIEQYWGQDYGISKEEVLELLAVAEAAAALIKAKREYDEFDGKARTAKDGVRYAVYNNMADERAMDMYRLSEALKEALSPLLKEVTE